MIILFDSEITAHLILRDIIKKEIRIFLTESMTHIFTKLIHKYLFQGNVGESPLFLKNNVTQVSDEQNRIQ